MRFPNDCDPMASKTGIDLTARPRSRWATLIDERISVQRDLPWRRTRDPWGILVSEVMLQQTQVDRVRHAWPLFLASFPTPSACAEKGQAAVVRQWEGMGYHRRAVALYRCAVKIVEEFEGIVPESEAALRSLPGIGPYTANAILAFAFERDVAVVDTNVARILSRAVAGTPLTQRQSQEIADDLVKANKGWAHNQAMLDFGAMVCRSSPLCDGCPLKKSCRWARSGFADPDPASKTAGTARPQAAFAGSDRQIRGKLLSLARAGRQNLEDISELEKEVGELRVQRLISSLVDDALVKVTARGLVLR